MAWLPFSCTEPSDSNQSRSENGYSRADEEAGLGLGDAVSPASTEETDSGRWMGPMCLTCSRSSRTWPNFSRPGDRDEDDEYAHCFEEVDVDISSEDSEDDADSDTTMLNDVEDRIRQGGETTVEWARLRWLSHQYRTMVRRGWVAQHRADNGRGPQPQKLPDGTPVTAEYWGMRKEQVYSYYQQCRSHKQWKDSLTIRDVNELFVKPETEGSWRSIALSMNSVVPKRVTVMISHCWAENAKEFFEDIESFLEEDEVPYICLLSNYQGTADDIALQLGRDIYQAPFTRVIKNRRCRRMLVVPNDDMRRRGEGLYSRLWCDWEIYYAARVGLPIHFTDRNSYDYLFGQNEEITSSRHAHCSSAEDEEIIRNAIESAAPRTRVIVAVQTLSVIYGAAYGISLGIWTNSSNNDNPWRKIVGGVLGFVVGAMLGSAWYCCPTVLSGEGSDAYSLLDDVILAAANGSYAGARPRTRVWVTSLICLFVTGAAVGYAVLIAAEQERDRLLDCEDKLGEDDCPIGSELEDLLEDLGRLDFTAQSAVYDLIFLVSIFVPLFGVVYIIPMAGMSRHIRVLKRVFVLSAGVSGAFIAGLLMSYQTKGSGNGCWFLVEAVVLGAVMGSVVCYVLVIPIPRWKQAAMILASFIYALVGYNVDGVYTMCILCPAGAMTVYALCFPEWSLRNRILFGWANFILILFLWLLHVASAI